MSTPPITLAHSKQQDGHSRDVSRKSFTLSDVPRGGARRLAAPSSGPFVQYAGENHLLTVAPTGAGKGRSAIIPTLLTYEGPVIVFDPKGENYFVTARRRREMGHKIVRLDPFRVAGEGGDSFNPFDLMRFPSENISDESRVLTDLLSVEDYSTGDPFWRIMGRSLMSSVIMYLAGDQSKYNKDLGSARRMLFSSDFVYDIACILDSEAISDEVRQEFEQFVGITDVTRSGILAMAKQTMTLFGVDAIKASFEKTTFDLNSIWNGERVSVYVIIPPNKIAAYRQIMRLWLGSFMSLLSTRKSIPPERTLFIVDEAGQLGRLQLLEQAITLLRGYGIQMWTFWQDLSQIRTHYGEGYHTIVSNCDILEFFAMRNHFAEREVGELLGVGIEEIKGLSRNEIIIVGAERNPVRGFKLDYLKDGIFAGLFDRNPYYPE